MKILAGDIGGTNTRLAILEDTRVLLERTYPTKSESNLKDCLFAFKTETGQDMPRWACLAVAGVVEGGQVKGTNIPWDIDAEGIRKSLHLELVKLINDFEAAAWGVTRLLPGQYVQLGGGIPESSFPKAVIGAGTGLGQAILAPCRDGYSVLATEGGHASFAPETEDEIGLLEFLMKSYTHVSVERVLSGPGLIDIHEFYRRRLGLPLTPKEETPPSITAAALSGSDRTCVLTLELFCRCYGAEAGNLALKSLARGGVFVAGGIAPKILPLLKRNDIFRNAFESKGRMKRVLQQIPTYVVTTPYLGLIGAAACLLDKSPGHPHHQNH